MANGADVVITDTTERSLLENTPHFTDQSTTAIATEMASGKKWIGRCVDQIMLRQCFWV